MSIRRAWIAWVVLVGACAPSSPPTNFTPGEYTFGVVLVWSAPPGGVASTSDPLSADDYAAVESGPTYALTVSEDGETVTVHDPLGAVVDRVAERGDDVGARLHFDVVEGAFAGGRFEVWEDVGLQGELTEFGSGVPIVASQRGAISPGAPTSP